MLQRGHAGSDRHRDVAAAHAHRAHSAHNDTAVPPKQSRPNPCLDQHVRVAAQSETHLPLGHCRALPLPNGSHRPSLDENPCGEPISNHHDAVLPNQSRTNPCSESPYKHFARVAAQPRRDPLCAPSRPPLSRLNSHCPVRRLALPCTIHPVIMSVSMPIMYPCASLGAVNVCAGYRP